MGKRMQGFAPAKFADILDGRKTVAITGDSRTARDDFRFGICVAKGRCAESNHAKRELGSVRELRQKAVCACRAGWPGQCN